jgi:probable HAF family extracellular repeat protein
MMKARKGLLGLFLALFILLSGVCVGDDSADILDFLPAFIRAKFGNAVVNPFFLVPGVSTPVTITTYIPDANLDPASVQLKDGTAIIGTLTDTGNKVFSITSNFQRDSGGAINLCISATLGTVNKTIARFEIKVLSLPTIQNTTQYNQAIDNIYTSLVATKDDFTVLQDSSISADQFLNNLRAARDRLLSVYASMEAIYRTETHSPSNIPIWVAYHTKFGGLMQSGQDMDDAIANFTNEKDYATDPRYADIRQFIIQSHGDYDLNISGDRNVAAYKYYTTGDGKFISQTLPLAGKVGVEGEMSQFTSLTGFGIGQQYGSAWGKATTISGNAITNKYIDIHTTNNNEMGMVAGTITNGQMVQLPAGSHDILFSFAGVLDRAIERNIPVNAGLTTTVNIAPGDVKLCKYSYQDLGTLGGVESDPYGINSSGQVVGTSWTITGQRHAFLWTPSGGMQDLGTLGGLNSFAYGINDSGQVVGVSQISTGQGHAFLWTQSGGMQDLVTSGVLNSSSSVSGINNSGQIFGRGQTEAFLWTPSIGMQDLGTLGGSYSYSYGINDSGQVVGYSTTNTGAYHAFLWTQSGGMLDLGVPAGYGLYSQANAINNSGQIVGCTSDAVMWTLTGGFQLLGTDAPESGSVASGINNNGQVVGYAGDNNYAILWTPSEGRIALWTLVVNLPPGVNILPAYAINDSGQIIASSFDGHNQRACLLTPVP